MSKIRAAVIGVGYLGRFHAQKYAQLPVCELVAVVDGREEVRKAVAGELGTQALADYRGLLGKVDAVSVVTPTPAHFEIADAFLAAGAHVLVEKPITETPEQARALIAQAAKFNRILQVGHLERFNAAVLAAEPRGGKARSRRHLGGEHARDHETERADVLGSHKDRPGGADAPRRRLYQIRLPWDMVRKSPR